ncbi:MAG: substrate-binding domain-containing protein [Prolixibacteraceae bacterium]
MQKYFLLTFLLIFSLLPAHSKNHEKKYLIGFSQCISSDTWRQTMQAEMQNELVLYPNFELVIKDANGNSQQQIQDVEDFLKMGIDLLIISPNESKPLTPVVQSVYQKGIPVIVIDRNIDSDDYTVYIGANNYEIGLAAGQYAANLLKGNGKIVEIWGLKGSTPALSRHKGFMDVISKYPDLQVIFSETGEWEEEGGRKKMSEALDLLENIDLVFAHNDYMALGAWQMAREKNRAKDISFLGVDGLPGIDGGVQQVIDHKLNATFLYPTGGDKAIDMAWQILNDEPIEKEMILQTVVIDSSNANVIKLQTDQILTLQDKIQTFKTIINEQLIKYEGQRTILIISLGFLFIVVALSFLLFTAYRSKNIINIKLEKHRTEIQKRNHELLEVSKKLEEATQAKLRFFTNLSHEFRTPLTLILGPLESTLAKKNLNKEDRHTFERMNRNANRLLRMINQLMDMRKIDNEKMDVRIGHYDLIKFVAEIKESFDELASKRNINFSFRSNLSKVELYFDFDKLDKIFFNLLSNAFKFTSDAGNISISIDEISHQFDHQTSEAVEIEIRDNGRGMSPEHIERIFDRFYQIEQESNKLGTGIGLSLTKSFVELHKGTIDVKSQKGKGTSFFIYLRKGHEHFDSSELITETDQRHSNNNLLDELVPTKDEKQEKETQLPFEDKPSVLVVEDNADVRSYIRESLHLHYRITEVENGLDALNSIKEEEPDLIVSDIMMPVMDGLEMTRKIKTDINTCHIPVILLTAKSSEQNRIEGIEEGADSYIPKPFNSKHLEVRVKKLIEGRRNIRAFYKNNYTQIEKLDEQISPLDKKFIRKVNDLIDLNLADSNFKVEALSEELNMSRVHFYRKIKSITDMTATEYLRNYKLKRAAAILMKNEFSISEVAYQTGFTSSSYFSKCFKELYTITPQQYMNS